MTNTQKTTARFLSADRGRVIFYLCLTAFLFWNVPLFVNVYSVKLVGTVFELLWLPMMLALFVLPVPSMLGWIKRRYTVRSIYFYSLLLSFINIATLFYRIVKNI